MLSPICRNQSVCSVCQVIIIIEADSTHLFFRVIRADNLVFIILPVTLFFTHHVVHVGKGEKVCSVSQVYRVFGLELRLVKTRERSSGIHRLKLGGDDVSGN